MLLNLYILFMKKKYENVFAKMAEQHNKHTVPILRKLNLRTVKIRNTRILKLRDVLEHSEDVLLSVDLLTEYIAINSFILELLDQSEINTCYDLIKTKSKENVLIAASCIYELVETKKKELLENNKNES